MCYAKGKESRTKFVHIVLNLDKCMFCTHLSSIYIVLDTDKKFIIFYIAKS